MARTTRISDLRERVSILQRSPTEDSQLGRVVTYVALDAVAAAIESSGGAGEAIEAGAVTALARHVVTLRHRSDVTPQMRLRWRTKTLQIHSVVADPRRAWLTLQCSEVQA